MGIVYNTKGYKSTAECPFTISRHPERQKSRRRRQTTIKRIKRKTGKGLKKKNQKFLATLGLKVLSKKN